VVVAGCRTLLTLGLKSTPRVHHRSSSAAPVRAYIFVRTIKTYIRTINWPCDSSLLMTRSEHVSVRSWFCRNLIPKQSHSRATRPSLGNSSDLSPSPSRRVLTKGSEQGDKTDQGVESEKKKSSTRNERKTTHDF
jgi:hypothetical protein